MSGPRLPAAPYDGILCPSPAAQFSGVSSDDEVQKPRDNKIRCLIEKTAGLFGSRRPESEMRLLSLTAGNPKFNFLLSSDPYHAYYQHCISDYNKWGVELRMMQMPTLEQDRRRMMMTKICAKTQAADDGILRNIVVPPPGTRPNITEEEEGSNAVNAEIEKKNDDQPKPKRQRVGDDAPLVPEDQFLAQHTGPIRISVSMPNAIEWILKFQLLEITIKSLSETVGRLKGKIAREIQLPAYKQNLSGRAGLLKDNASLAYYNIGPGETLYLTLGESGGRKG